MDFLAFNSFISIPVLIGFYIIGAVVCPVAMWWCMRWLVRRYPLLGEIRHQGKAVLWHLLPGAVKWKMAALFAAMFLFGELLWRLLFEFLIGYMQMHDALVKTLGS